MPSPVASADDSESRGKLFLIAAGTASYDHLEGDQLPSLKDDLDRIVKLFTGDLGYERVLPGLGDNPTSDELCHRLSEWLTERDPSDRIVFYYSGHGVVEGRDHYLLTKDSRVADLVGTAFPTALLGQKLYETKIQQTPDHPGYVSRRVRGQRLQRGGPGVHPVTSSE